MGSLHWSPTSIPHGRPQASQTSFASSQCLSSAAHLVGCSPQLTESFDRGKGHIAEMGEMHISDLSGGILFNAKWATDNESRFSVRGRGTSMCDTRTIPRCGLIWSSCQSWRNRHHLQFTKEEDEAWRCGPSWWVRKPVFNSGLPNPEPELYPLSLRAANELTFTLGLSTVYVEERKRKEHLSSTSLVHSSFQELGRYKGEYGAVPVLGAFIWWDVNPGRKEAWVGEVDLLGRIIAHIYVYRTSSKCF